MRFPWTIRAFRVSVPVEELAAAERQNAAAQAEIVRLVKALTAAEERADRVADELSSSMTEVTNLRERVRAYDLMRAEWKRYAKVLCPRCGDEVDEDGPGADVLATDPTEQEPRWAP